MLIFILSAFLKVLKFAPRPWCLAFVKFILRGRLWDVFFFLLWQLVHIQIIFLAISLWQITKSIKNFSSPLLLTTGLWQLFNFSQQICHVSFLIHYNLSFNSLINQDQDYTFKRLFDYEQKNYPKAIYLKTPEGLTLINCQALVQSPVLIDQNPNPNQKVLWLQHHILWLTLTPCLAC